MPIVMNYDAIVVGEDLGCADYTLTAEITDKLLEAVEDFHPWHTQDSPFGSRIGHPITAAIYCMSLFLQHFIFPEGAIHAKQRWAFLNPFRHGTTVRTRGRVIDKYIKKERKYVVVEMRSEERESGIPVLEGQSTILLMERP